MSTLLERLRAALAPEYEVEGELGSGGMGMVFLGRDPGLERAVAIKVLRPELASAHGTERFLREARLLAKLTHRHIVPVYQVGERDGISFYVMKRLDGETLADRLARGTLSTRQAIQIARDVLSALETAHAQGIVHRDVKPDNIILEPERGSAVLTDFGIAKSLSDGAVPLTFPGQTPGTLEYMPPEQVAGGEVTARTDLYAVAMVIYEAITGRHWSILERPETADWSGVPRRARRALRKALAWAPADRFADAAAFQRALWVPRPQPLVWPAAAVVALAALVVGAFVFCRPLGFCTAASSPLQVYELMVEPFDVTNGTPPRLGTEIALIVSDKLALFPQIALVPRNVAFKRREAPLLPLHVAARVVGSVAQSADSIHLRLEVRDSLDRRLYNATVSRPTGAEVEIADSGVLRVLRWLHPELLTRYGPRPTWGLNAAALAEFLQGEDAFRRDAWTEAARHFRQALALDPRFARAAWRLTNAQRWRRMPPGVDLRMVLMRQSRYLNPLDSLLIAAELAPLGEPRHRIYQQALALYPREPYARLLYGAELMHRGPLAGISIDSAAAVLEEAVAQDPYLAPAHDLFVWALIRLGRREDARRALDRLKQMRAAAAGAGESELSIASSLEVAFAARFSPGAMPAMPTDVERDLALTARMGSAFDIPDFQLALGQRLSGASGHEAQGLALMALGRPIAAGPYFDSAAVLFGAERGSVARQLEAFEWRVLPAALGVPGLVAGDVDKARDGLAAIASGRGPVAARAAWASAVDAYARGDSAAARRWRSRLRALVGDNARLERLDGLVAGLELAARGNRAGALARTAPLLAFEEWPQLGDPFARAVLHIRRAEWLEARNRPDSALRSLQWYQNSDFAHWLSDTLQAAEIDWSLGALSRWRRATIAQRAGSGHAWCAELGRVLELWAGAEPAFLAAAQAQQLRETRCPQ